MADYPVLENRLCITAGAGAGKTRRLVETYLGLLTGAGEHQALQPNQVVAITFTEKAANEMRARVASQLAELAAKSQGKPHNPDWQGMLAQVEWAPISTIHSFCRRLLMEFGAAMGLDPDFRVLDQNEFAELLEEVIQEVLRTELVAPEGLLDRLLAQKSLNGSYGLSGLLAEFYHHLTTLGVRPRQALDATQQAHADEETRQQELGRQFCLSINELADARIGELAKSKAKFLVKLDKLLARCRELGLDKDASVLNLNRLNELEPLLKGNWGKTNELRRPAIEALQELKLLIAVPMSAQLTGNALELLAKVDLALEKELAGRAALSFDHLLLKAKTLLETRPEVLFILRQRFQALLVDEFQDVNPVQGDLMRFLAGLEEPLDPDSADQDAPLPRLLVVGDRKQSIYAFRGADVGQFSQTMTEFEAGVGKVEALPNNYRTCHELVYFFNRLFEKVFSAHSLDDPELLRLYLNFRPDDAQNPARQKQEGLDHPLEVVKITAPPEAKADKWRTLEAGALALYLKDLVLNQGVNPGNIAVLLTKLTSVNVYEDALRKQGVGFYTVKGRGFFACQEISDIYLALQSLLHPEDDLALCGFLRSGLLGLSDEALVALRAGSAKQGCLMPQAMESGLNLSSTLEGEQADRWDKALNIFKKWSPLIRRMSPYAIMENILAETDVIPLLAADPDGEQKIANIRKLLEMAREAQSGPTGCVEDFLVWLGERLENPGQEPQAPLMGEEAQVVRFMTVHQAKGLEFDVVILADLDSTINQGNSLPSPLPQGIFAINPLDFDTGEVIKSSIYAKLANRQKAVYEAESARLFYVACTRAMEKLVFLFREKEKGRSGLWSKWVSEFVLADELTRQVSVDDLEILFEDKDPGHMIDSGDTPMDPAGECTGHAVEIIDHCLQDNQPAPNLITESVSSLENFLHCQRLYFFTRRWGLDTAQLAVNINGNGEPAQGARIGSLVHKLLENARFSYGPDSLKQAADQMALCGQASELEVQRAKDLALKAWETDLPDIINEFPEEHLFREQGFRLYLKGNGACPDLEVIGEFDLVLVRPGRHLIVDYKVSEAVHPENYQTQLGIYALALGRTDPSNPPETRLCYLNSKGGTLLSLDCNEAYLKKLEQNLLAAASGISRIPLNADPWTLPVSPLCSAACPLQKSGFCRGKGAE